MIRRYRGVDAGYALRVLEGPGNAQLLATFNANPPADPSAIARFEAESGLRLPPEYVEFLKTGNGGEGFVSSAYVILWRVDELIEANQGYQVTDYTPGLLLFGSDGGGEAFAFDMRSDGMPIVSIPFIPMELALALPMGSGFSGFLEGLFKS